MARTRPMGYAIRGVIPSAVLVLVVSTFGIAVAVAETTGIFVAAGDMSTPRYFQTATRLQDGRVLIAGGASAVWGDPTTVEATAELYEPSTGTFVATGRMTSPRWGHTATLLRDGRVLVVGGSVGDAGPFTGSAASAELYDPLAGVFTPTTHGPTLPFPYGATLLADGRVLVLDGTGVGAELYDPETDTFARTGEMLYPAADTATVLANGMVLVTHSLAPIAGNLLFLRHAELYDPSTGTFTATGDMVTFHASPTATLLRDGRVLIVGGDIGEGDGPSTVAELYDPTTGTFSLTGGTSIGREDHTATLLLDGTVLVSGGHGGMRVAGGGFDNWASAELYDPGTGTFRAAAAMATGRDRHVATLLANGSVLVTGGAEYYPFGAGNRPPIYGLLASAELYTAVNGPLPFGTAPLILPGIVEAEDFDQGGELIAYHDVDSANRGGAYRPDTAVDLEHTGDIGGGVNVGWITAGEWLQYTVSVAASGTYTLTARVAADGPGGTFHVEFGGINRTGPLTIRNTNGWQHWTDVTATVTLTAGTQSMRFVADQNGPGPAVFGNLNYIRVTPSGSQPPGIVQFTVTAEQFSAGGQGCWEGPFQCGGGYYDETPGNWGDAQVRPGTDVDLWYDDGAVVIGGLDGLEWVTFPVSVPQSGQYAVTFRTASPSDRPAGSGMVNVGIHGVDGSWVGNQVVPVTGGPGEWHNYVTWNAPGTIFLPAGNQTLTMWAPGGWYNVRHMVFRLVGAPVVPDAIIPNQLNPMVLSGTVRNEAGTPLPGARINLTYAGAQYGNQYLLLVTDVNGRYTVAFDAVPNAWYGGLGYAWVEKDFWTTYELAVLFVNVPTRHATYDFILREIKWVTAEATGVLPAFIDLTVMAPDPLCENNAMGVGWGQVYLCHPLRVIPPSSGTLRIETIPTGPVTGAIGIEVEGVGGDPLRCCQAPSVYLMPVTAGETVFVNPFVSPDTRQSFRLYLSIMN